MKMNFKYVMMAAVLSMGFAACSNNDDDAVDNNLPVEGAKSFATITLKSDAVTRVATTNATPAEEAIHSVKVYVFNSLKVLEDIQVFTATELATNPKQKTIETTAGTHYFMAVANAPEVTVPLGTNMNYLSQLITNINKTKFDGYLDPDLTLNLERGFFMTSGVYTNDLNSARYYRTIDYAEADLVAWDGTGTTPTTNEVKIPIGRAMAKVSLVITDSSYPVVPGGTLTVIDTKYTVANNPVQMYYFPYFGTTQQFQTPTYKDYDTSTAPSNYWPALNNTQDTDYQLISAGKPIYALENSNEVPTYGNATIISIKAKFTPNAASLSGSFTTDSTFYRVYDKAKNEFWVTTSTSKSFWVDIDGANAILTANATESLEVIKYTDGYCYYIIPLKNKNIATAPEWYNVIRNHYYDVKISKINGCGHNKPGGGDGPGVDTKPTDPLDPNTYNVVAEIEVQPWILVTQTEEIGFN